jgi:CRP/FNR family transcriptional regulator, cyclic AMP receptor protein
LWAKDHSNRAVLTSVPFGVREDLIDQLFNSSEKRLARALLLLANFGKDGRQESVIAKVPRDARGHGWHNALPRESLYE